jgi:hypothetical protein
MRLLTIAVLSLLLLRILAPKLEGTERTEMNSRIAPEYLRCEYKVNPLGIDVKAPRLSWIAASKARAQKQTAYRILVAVSEEKLAADNGDLWDTGKIKSNETAQIVYEGKPLKSEMQCFWKVKVWDGDGKESDWSKPALWTMLSQKYKLSSSGLSTPITARFLFSSSVAGLVAIFTTAEIGSGDFSGNPLKISFVGS